MKPSEPSRGALILLVSMLALAGCGEKKKDRAALTLAARVNGEEVTLNQVNLVLQQRNLRPEQADAASRQVLERLIDQALAVQQAERAGLDRDARVQLQLEAARRDVLARAFIDSAADAATPPSDDDIRRYYDERPALFRERHVFVLQELVIEAAPEQAAQLREMLASTTQLATFVEHLKSAGVRYTTNQVQRGAEQLPAPVLEMLQRMKEGQASVNLSPGGLQVLILSQSRPQPLDEAAARPAIERLLLAERKRQIVDERLKAMRASARIEYLGSYAPGPRPADAASAAPAAAAGSQAVKQ